MAVGGFVQGIGDMSGAVQGFRAATAAGFTISPEGAQALVDAIDDMLAGTATALMKAEVLGQEPQLGTTPAARVYRPFLATIASDPAQGFVPAVHRLQADLQQLRAEVVSAISTYRRTDDDRAHDLKNTGGSPQSA